ncbi:hypothetical protein LCGC14_3028940, partial [marine sediment metagenome]
PSIHFVKFLSVKSVQNTYHFLKSPTNKDIKETAKKKLNI